MENNNKGEISRRKFLGIMTGVPLVLSVGTPAVAVGKMISPPEALRPLPPRMAILKEDELLEKPKEIIYDGLPAMIFKKGNEYRAFSRVCTHLGCTVMWNEAEKRFECPCHGGIFDEDGNVLVGPPPKPLTRLRAWVEDGYVMVQREVV